MAIVFGDGVGRFVGNVITLFSKARANPEAVPTGP
jgi:hypothetical protein